MTTKPQGVAQRVISEMEQQRGQFETEQEHIAAVRAGGMRMLHTELSAEARAILQVEKQRCESAIKKYGINSAQAVEVCSFEFGSRSLARRLGLDIDHDEAEGE